MELPASLVTSLPLCRADTAEAPAFGVSANKRMTELAMRPFLVALCQSAALPSIIQVFLLAALVKMRRIYAFANVAMVIDLSFRLFPGYKPKSKPVRAHSSLHVGDFSVPGAWLNVSSKQPAISRLPDAREQICSGFPESFWVTHA
jgi:hypothetical protein